MIRILFLIHDLGQGGAEKVLVNLVNNMDRSKFDISVAVLFGGGVNEQFLKPDIHFRAVFPRAVPGNSRLMKLLTPAQLHRLCVRERYDIEVSYLEGPSARIISGCQDPDTKLVSWIHSTFASGKDGAASFRGYGEAAACFSRFHRTVCASEGIRRGFIKAFPAVAGTCVLYNTVESDVISGLAKEPVPAPLFSGDGYFMTSVGSMKPVKGFDRLLRIHQKLRRDGWPVHTCLLGRGPELERLQRLADSLGVADSVSFPGYDTNPYKYVARSHLYVCASWSEGFSTAVTEALIVGTPVCTVEVSGMRELLGEHNEYGVITENSEEALYEGIKKLLEDPACLAEYRERAARRGRDFETGGTVRAVERMLEGLLEK